MGLHMEADGHHPVRAFIGLGVLVTLGYTPGQMLSLADRFYQGWAAQANGSLTNGIDSRYRIVIEPLE
jgi:hypothetical protein